MPTEHIKYTDSLRQGTDKLNAAIDLSNTAVDVADNAVTLMNEGIATIAVKTDEAIAIATVAAENADGKAEEANQAATNANAVVTVVSDLVEQVEGWEFLGEYNPSVTYMKNNSVRFNGSMYIAIADSTGNPPTNAAYWGLIAQRGVDGSGAVSSVEGELPDINGDVKLPTLATKQELQTVDIKLSSHMGDIEKHRTIKIFNKVPSEKELLSGEIGLVLTEYANPLVETIEIDTLENSKTSSSMAGVPSGRKAAIIYIPSTNIDVTKLTLEFLSGILPHDTSNDLRVTIYPDDGNGLPDELNPLASTILTENPSTPSTSFRKTAVFAESSNNYVSRVSFIANQKYYIVIEVVSGASGTTVYYVWFTLDANDPNMWRGSYNNNAWDIIPADSPVFALYKAVPDTK